MRELVLMARGSEQMNVPSEKVQAYLDEGWTELSRVPLESVSVETVAESKIVVPAPKAEKPKAKGK